jgi:hypothetical protein
MALVFDSGFVLGHKLATQFLSDLDTLCRRDYNGKEYFRKQIVCLDMDAYETSLSGNNDATMDAAVGIATYENNRMSDSRHLLVELRFNYKSTNNFDVANMRNKVSHTKSLLPGERVHDKMVFIYTDEVAPKAKSYFSRLSKQYRDLCNWNAISVDEYFDYVRDKNSFPYQPINDLGQIVTELKSKFLSSGLEGLNTISDYWMGEMEKYNMRYNKEESRAIAKVVLNFWDQLPQSNDSFENDYIAFVKEKLNRYII